MNYAWTRWQGRRELLQTTTQGAPAPAPPSTASGTSGPGAEAANALAATAQGPSLTVPAGQDNVPDAETPLGSETAATTPSGKGEQHVAAEHGFWDLNSVWAGLPTKA